MSRTSATQTTECGPNQLRARKFIQRIANLGGAVVLNGDGVSVRLDAGVTSEMCAEAVELKPDLVELLRTEAEALIDDPEEKSHSDMRSLPAPELSRDDKLAASLKASKRRYQNGMVGINDHKFAQHMRELVRLQERRQAADRGEILEGRYLTRFDIFG